MKALQLILPVLLTAAAFAPLAQASSPMWDIPQVEVSYGDLNLANPVGAEIMLRRLQSAAIQVCGGRAANREIRWRLDYQSCVRLAIETAVRKINAPLLTALNEDRPVSESQLAQGNFPVR